MDKKNKELFSEEITAAATTYWGMDVLQYPGDSGMQNIWSNSPLYFTGFYLAPAPNQSYTGWMNKRSTLLGQGWGFLPLYLGRQHSDSNLTAAQGKTDAQDAISLANKAGFDESTFHTYIYLDIEQGGRLETNYINYIKSWVTEINASADYWAGIYCSYSNTAQQIYDAIGSSASRYWVFNLNEYSCSDVPSGTAPDPSDSGVSFASTWQLVQNCNKTFGSTTLSKVDIDSSTRKDPSQ